MMLKQCLACLHHLHWEVLPSPAISAGEDAFTTLLWYYLNLHVDSGGPSARGERHTQRLKVSTSLNCTFISSGFPVVQQEDCYHVQLTVLACAAKGTWTKEGYATHPHCRHCLGLLLQTRNLLPTASCTFCVSVGE